MYRAENVPVGERGAIAVFVAIIAVALIGIGALAMDIGWAYSDRRQMQNASDAAAVAGTKQLTLARWTADNTATPPAFKVNMTEASRVQTVVQEVLQANRANPSDFTCEVFGTDAARTTIANCSATATWATLALQPVGVRVIAKTSRASGLGRVLGSTSVSVLARAAAEVRPVTGGAGTFLVCAFDQKSNGDTGTPLPNILNETAVPSTGTPPWTTINPPIVPNSGTVWTINKAALWDRGTGVADSGPQYVLHDPKNNNCQINNNSWKGLADPNQEVLMPGEFGTDTGTKAGPTRVAVANACNNPDVLGCVIQVPICVGSVNRSPASRSTLWCVKVGAFKITYTDSNSHRGRLLGEVIVDGPVFTGPGAPQVNEPRSIQLVE